MNKNHSTLTVHKFGGTSLSCAKDFRNILSLTDNKPAAIVVSATAGTTSKLQQLLTLAEQQQSTTELLTELQQVHHQLIHELLSDQAQQHKLTELINQHCATIKELLQTVKLLGCFEQRVKDKMLSFGELWSATILDAFLKQSSNSTLIDASTVLSTYIQNDRLRIDYPKSQQALNTAFNINDQQYWVITGFIAQDEQGQLITLERNGSDYSAAIFAGLLKAKQLVLWTDVDGIYSADPNQVRSAFPLRQLTYEEAMELAYFGAKVIHPQTLFPAISHQIPIIIKNSKNPQAQGTLISAESSDSPFLIKGLSCINDIALINLEGSGMTGISGIAARVFQELYHHNISVILISQASSEHSICLALKRNLADKAIKVLHTQFQFEIEQRLIKRISADTECVILAAVGDGMIGKQGVAGRLCNTLAKANVNIRAIAQGSSERNISVVINEQDSQRALRAVHAGFYLSSKTLSVGLIGPGQVGNTLLSQIQAALASLQEKHQVNLLVRGIMRSKKMLLSEQAIDLNNWQQQFTEQSVASDMNSFIKHIAADDMPHAVIIDCTASQHIADQYSQFIQQGLHIVTPNKKANSGDFTAYQQLKQKAQDNNQFYFYETTVCAGLPTIKTLQDIITTGDEVLCIQGIVSGTLSLIFNQLSQGGTFSSIVMQAKESGFTEPDPRDDLSGMDVARKFVCLARELGHSTELSDIQVTNLVPEALRDVTLDEFLTRLPDYDEEIAKQLAPILTKQEKPCYIGTIDQRGNITVNIEGADQDNPFSRLSGTDNMLIFTTKRYQPQPLVIQGPGAGTEVTAAGIFSDLLRLIDALDK